MTGASGTLITCLGDSLIDFLPFEDQGAIAGFRLAPGGSIFNVAVGLARLQVPVAYAGKVADDYFGQRLRAAVAAEGIETGFIVPHHGQTTLAFVVQEQSGPAYDFYGEGTADTLLSAAELPAALFAQTGLLHIGSTSLLRGSTPGAVLAAAERLNGRALISLDPNVRPALVRDELAYRQLLGQLVRLSDLVKLSDADIAWLAPAADVISVATRLLSDGTALVALTRGASGALALRQGEPPVEVPAFHVPVVDTVGAGDAFAAGLLAGLWERGVRSRGALAVLPRAALGALLRDAQAAAALTSMRAGAQPPTRAEVAAFLREWNA